MIIEEFHGHEFVFQTSPSVFSYRKIDSGTKFLLESIKVDGAKNILDIGCGYGALGIILAKLHPRSQVILVDNNPEALALCKENIRLNNLQNCRVLPTSAAGTLSKFNLALSNLPWHQNKTAIPKIISLAFEALLQNGLFYVVTNYKYKTEEKIAEVFGNVQFVAQKAPYKVLRAKLPSVSSNSK